ncbi:MAG: glycosyl hydrolase [Bacteroidota bacterium]|nr:glycosyl hydrolase [Bacteroidota bacterium]
MGRKTHRILIIILAFAAAIAVILILSFIGGKSRGPLEGLLSDAGAVVTNVESKVIIRQRSYKRADDLKWLRAYIRDIALLKHPRVILLGAYDNQTTENFESINDFEDSLHMELPLIHIYTAWGSKPEQQFPEKQVKAIIEMGSIPVITWEPWLSSFDSKEWTQLRKPEVRDKNGMTDVARGKYDRYIQQWAMDAKRMNYPIFLRVGHEMNDPYRYPWGPQNNSAKDFKAAWRHIYNVFKTVGAGNIIWIWSPHPAYGYFDAYYPGKDYVDYVGVGILNYGNVASWSKWWTFDEIFGNHYKELSKYKKPIIITEFGCLNAGGNRSRWFQDALKQLPLRYPSVKSIIFFHYSADHTTTQQTLNWYIKDDSCTMNSINRQIRLWPDSVKP